MANGKPQTTIIDRSQTTIIGRSRVINIVRIIRIIKLTKAACANKHANESQKREQHFIGFSRFLEGGSTMPHQAHCTAASCCVLWQHHGLYHCPAIIPSAAIFIAVAPPRPPPPPSIPLLLTPLFLGCQQLVILVAFALVVRRCRFPPHCSTIPRRVAPCHHRDCAASSSPSP